MSPRVIFRRHVTVDLFDIHAFLQQHSPAAAERFLVGVESSIDRLREFPGIGSPKHFRGRFRGIRSWRVEGFPNYLIFYRPAKEAIVVLGILHGARHIPKALRDREV